MHRYSLTLSCVLAAFVLCEPAVADRIPGDANCDAIVNFEDIDPFVLAVIDVSIYEAQYPDCPLANVDVDGNGEVDFNDIDPFVDALLAGGVRHLELAGNSLPLYPSFEYVRAFNQDATVEIAIDPSRVPELVGVTADIYVIAGGSGPDLIPEVDPVAFTFGEGGIEQNTVLVATAGTLSGEAGIDIGRPYDIVLDVNRNGQLDSGDYIDDGGADEAGLYVIHDLTAAGPFEQNKVNISLKLKGVSGKKPARLFYPKNIAELGKLPLVVIGHGGGHQYTWYDYLQSHLASYGCISISHENNTDGYEGRTPRVLLNTDAILEQQGTIEGGVLDGHIDETRIVFIGHSLGGEEAIIGGYHLKKGKYKPTYFTPEALRLVAVIAATSAVTEQEGGTAYDYPTHLLWGSADGDIGGQPGCDVCQPFQYIDRGTGYKGYTYIHGADHEDFNCCGVNDFNGPKNTEIGREETQRVAKAVFLALVKHYVDGNVPAKDLLWRQWERFKPIGVKDTTTVVCAYHESPATEKFVIDDFQTNTAKDVSSSGGKVEYSVGHVVEDKLRDKNFDYTWNSSDPMNGMTYALSGDRTRGMVFDWDSADTYLEFEVVPAGSDFARYKYLSFRVCQGTRHPFTLAEDEDLVFNVTLRDESGATSTINIAAYGGGVEETYRRTGGGNGAGWQNEFETTRIRLTDFLTDGAQLDLTKIKAVRFDFGPDFGADKGRLGFDDLEVTVD